MADDWRKIINGAIRVYMVRAEHWPQAAKFLLAPNAAFDEPALDSTLAMAAVNGVMSPGDPDWDDRMSALWIISEATAKVLNRQMHKRLRGVPEAIEITTRQIFEELKLVAGDPLRWTYFSFPWGEPGSELAQTTRTVGGEIIRIAFLPPRMVWSDRGAVKPYYTANALYGPGAARQSHICSAADDISAKLDC